MEEPKLYNGGLEEYSKVDIILENSALIIWIVLGAIALSFFSQIIAIVYVLAALVMIVFVLRKLLCTNCYYYGKWCHVGWGKLAALFFKKGDINKFNTGIGQTLAPATYGLLAIIPIIAIIASVIQEFSALKIGIFLGILLVSGYSGAISRKKSCSMCKMKLNCKGCAV